MSLDIVIRGGTIVDGTGAPRFRADLGVENGRIVGVGRVEDSAAQEIDAGGMLVCPGFIEGHAHMDAQIFWDPRATPSSMHGVTTLIMGNCGFTLAPVRPGAEDLVVRSIERAEDISRRDLECGVPWGWRSFADYLAAVEETPKAVNVACYVGHSALRTYVMGERAYHEEATKSDLDQMESELRAALEGGAVGFSSSRLIDHLTMDDQPVASYIGSWSEVERLVGAMGQSGKGVFQLATDLWNPETQAKLLTLSLESGLPIHQPCVQLADEPDALRSCLTFLDRAANAGARIVGQANVRHLANVMGFRVGLPFDGLPQWKGLRSAPLREQRLVLQDSVRREQLVREAIHGPYVTSKALAEVQARAPDFNKMQVLMFPTGPNPSVAELASEWRTTPVDLIIDLSLENDFDQYFVQPFANQDESAVEEILRHPRTVVALSDSGAHVSQIMDSSTPTYFLGYWVRSRAAFSWEEGIHMLTGRNAAEWSMADRGEIRTGYHADIVVIDPEEIGPGLPFAVSDLPAGGTRLMQESAGIRATVVGGVVTALAGEATGEFPGRVLRWC